VGDIATATEIRHNHGYTYLFCHYHGGDKETNNFLDFGWKTMETWQKIFLVVLAGGVLYMFLPSVRASLKNSPKAKKGEWKSVLLPIGIVILFVLLLISSVRG
jgi:hypothetical protein